MPTIEELGKKTKAKYPEYASMSDEEVGKRVVAKYPEYRAVVTPSDNRSGVQKVADFMGLGTTAKNIKTLGNFGVGPSDLGKDFIHVGKGQDQRTKAFSQSSEQAFKQAQELTKKAKETKDPQIKQALLDQARKIMSGSSDAGESFTADLNKRQLSSGITETDMGRSNAEFALRRGAGQTAELVSYALPGAVGGPTASISNRVVQAAGKGAIAGGLQGAAGAAGQSENILDALARTGAGGVVGAVTGAGVQGLFETGGAVVNAFKDVAGSAKNKLSDLYKSSLKQNIGDKKFYRQYGGEDKVVADALKYKVPTTKAGVEKELNNFRKEYNTIIENETKTLQQQGKRINISRAFKSAKDEIQKRFGYDSTLLDLANRWFDSNSKYAKATNALPKTANDLRKLLDKKVGDILTTDAAPADAARKAFATELRKEFKNLASEETKDAITKYHLLSGLSSAMKKEPVTSLPELMGASIFRSNPLSAVLGLAGTKAIRSPGLKRSIVVGAEKLANSPRVNVSQINPTPIVNPAVAALQRALDNKLKFNTSTTRLPSSNQ